MIDEDKLKIFLNKLKPFIEGALPTHKKVGGEEDRKRILQDLNKLLSILSNE